MGALTQAYKTLSDELKRSAYDKYLESSGAYELSGRKTEAQLLVDESAVRAKECIRAGNFVGSIAWLRKCVQLAPNDPSYHAMLARSLGKVPQYRGDAIVHFNKAIALDPWKLDAYSQLAQLYEEMELRSQASATYSRILAINPADTVARERQHALGS